MNRFYNVLAALAVALTPAAMMSAAGWEAYAATLNQTGIAWLAVVAGVATAAALECVGILAGETALLFHGRADRRWRIAAAVLLAYVLAGLYVLWATPLIFLPVLAGAVYILVGLRAQAQREATVQTVQAEDDREWEREKWRIQQADRTRVKLAASTPVQATTPPVASSVQASTNGASSHASTSIYACKQCKETFPTMQGLGAHVRHSHGKVTHE
jgi:hypothetical protein